MFAPHLNILNDWTNTTDDNVAVVKNAVVQCITPYSTVKTPIKLGVQLVDHINKGFHINVVDADDIPRFHIDVSIQGDLTSLTEERPLDTKEIEMQCELKSFPDGDFTNDGKFTIRNLYGDADKSYEAMYESERMIHDQLLRVSNYDTKECKAYVLVRYAWGMNVQVALVDEEKKMVYTWACSNYDYPDGIALRKSGPEIEVFRSTGSETIHHVGKPNLLCLDNLYMGSKWVTHKISRDFDCLKTYLNIAKSDDEFKNFKSSYDALHDRFEDEMKANEYVKAIATGQQILALPYSELRRGLDGSYNMLVKYNMACEYALIGLPDEAMTLLLQIESEWDKWEHLNEDSDLISLHDREDFKSLVARHPYRREESESESDE